MGTPLVYLINVLARFLGFVLKIDHGLDKNFERIVLSKYVGLGSIIQATPLIQTLRRKYPSARLIFVSTSANKVLLQHIPEIDEVHIIQDQTIRHVFISTFRFIMSMWKLKPDLFIDLEFYSNYSSIVTTISKAKNRLGFYKQNKPYRKGVYNYLVPFTSDQPISETYLQFANLIGCNPLVKKLKIELPDSSHGISIAQKTGIIPGQKYIVVNPNASDLRLERRWPKTYYSQLIAFILKHYPHYKVVLIGNMAETVYVQDLELTIPDRNNLVNSAGKLTLSELIYLIAGCELIISNDTGPMHIAFAMGCKSIALFGPCSPQQYGHVNNSIIFYKHVHCSPCVHKYLTPPCNGANICMTGISVEEVKNAVVQTLR